MDIGTAKPSASEREGLPHHLIDIRSPEEQFNAGDFVRLAKEAIDDIAKRGAIPVVSGGTGFYLKNLVLGLPEAPPSDLRLRETLKQELLEKGAAALMGELARFDPESACKIHLNDEYRLLRALEVLRLSGRPLSSFKASGGGASGTEGPQYNFHILGLALARDALNRRINERCAAMFSKGLPEEVRRLHSEGYTPADPGLRAIGYREFFVEEPSQDGRRFRLSQDLAGLEALVAMNSRRYAKRQITFFASLPGAKQIEAGKNGEETIKGLLS
jgi:tRNA dimethylallyltransferase